jgi:transposase
MDHFAGLDVSVKDTSVRLVDETGKIIREVKVASEPDALLAVLTNRAYHFKRIGPASCLKRIHEFSALGKVN